MGGISNDPCRKSLSIQSFCYNNQVQQIHRRRVFLLCICLLISAAVHAGEKSDSRGKNTFRFLPPEPLFKAYIAESLSTANHFEIQWANKAPPGYPWPEGYGKRPLISIRLGMELPVMGGNIGNWAWYFGFPLSLNFLTDMFQADTAPVVNTDYWFGTRLEVLYKLNTRWPRNIGLRLLPFYHESTHIGDEVSLYWSRQDPEYYRINVSYEAWEFVIGLDEWDGGPESAYTLRIGVSGRWNTDGYYPLPVYEEYGIGYGPYPFHLSRGRIEYFGQMQIQVPSGFPAIGNWMFQGGLEVRNRILFDYFSDVPEVRGWTIVSSIGWYRYPENWKGRKIGFYLRILGGQNPHGQYREQYGYFSIGTGVSLGL